MKTMQQKRSLQKKCAETKKQPKIKTPPRKNAPPDWNWRQAQGKLGLILENVEQGTAYTEADHCTKFFLNQNWSINKPCWTLRNAIDVKEKKRACAVSYLQSVCQSEPHPTIKSYRIVLQESGIS